MLTGAMLRGTSVKTVGLCHSVQVCAKSLLETLGMECSEERAANLRAHIAGINHMAWLLSISENGKDLYPELKKLADEKIAQWRAAKDPKEKSGNMIRIEMMRRFGFYVTESSEHNAEYQPYWIKAKYPELIEEYNIPLDEYPRRCIRQIEDWKKQYAELSSDPHLSHKLSHEYGSGIMEAVVTNKPFQIGGNVLNNGFIPNLPSKAVVEVPCLVDGNGVQGCYVGELPTPVRRAEHDEHQRASADRRSRADEEARADLPGRDARPAHELGTVGRRYRQDVRRTHRRARRYAAEVQLNCGITASRSPASAEMQRRGFFSLPAAGKRRLSENRARGLNMTAGAALPAVRSIPVS